MAIDVEVGDDSVDISFSGLDALWTLRRSASVAYAEVTGVRIAEVDEVREALGWRLGGTSLPGAVTAGNYAVRGHRGHRQLWCVYHDEEVLVIETDLVRPWRIVLQHPDRARLAWWIAERLPA